MSFNGCLLLLLLLDDELVDGAFANRGGRPLPELLDGPDEVDLLLLLLLDDDDDEDDWDMERETVGVGWILNKEGGCDDDDDDVFLLDDCMMGLLDFHAFSNSFGMGFVYGAFLKSEFKKKKSYLFLNKIRITFRLLAASSYSLKLSMPRPGMPVLFLSSLLL